MSEVTKIIISATISALVSAIFGVVGWHVIDHQNRKLRKEEIQYSIYKNILSHTNNMIKELVRLKTFITNDGISMLKQLNDIAQKTDAEKEKCFNEWDNKTSFIIQKTYDARVLILDYMRTLDMGGTNFGRESEIYGGLKSVSIDINSALNAISAKWIRYVNFREMHSLQIEELINDTTNVARSIDEFIGCLEDVLVHIYNSYIAEPLELNKRSFAITEKRRYITERGIIDNR